MAHEPGKARPYTDYRGWRRNNSILTTKGKEWYGTETKAYANTAQGKRDEVYSAPMVLKTSERGEKHYVRIWNEKAKEQVRDQDLPDTQEE